MQDARRQQPQDRLLAVYDEGMARVRPTAITHHHVGVLRVDVDDLPFALVAPLGPDHDYDRHALLL
jgi:hypothetical protein